MMQDHITEPSYPRVRRSVSLFCQDARTNTDKEYHLQVVEVAAQAFVVNYQYGRRGAKLADKTKTATPVSHSRASLIFGDKLAEQRGKGYEEIDLQSLGRVYATMKEHEMDSAGVDLFMNRRGDYISLIDYARLAGGAGEVAIGFIQSYTVAREAKEFLVKELGQEIDSQLVYAGMPIVTRMLRQSGLDAMGVFLGYRDGSEICRGIPPECHPRTMPKP